MQIINVDLIPGKVMPILHASQFDIGRQLGVKLYNGGAVYDLTGAEVVSISVRKPDGNIVTETLANAGGSLVEIITTEQMTACAGCSLCEIKIENAGDVIGTANFVLDVEEDPTNGGIASQSEINNLATQVANLVSEQYDSGNVIFDATPTAGHGNGYTVTSEGIKNALDAINNPDASAVNYDNTDSGLTATNAQDAIDEVNDKADTNATNIGSLPSLTTTDKSSLVGAVNEVNGKVNAIGTLLNGTSSGGSMVFTRTWAAKAQITLTKGVWVIVARVILAQDNNGYRAMNIAATSGDNTPQCIVMGITGNLTSLNLTSIANVTSPSTTFYLNAVHNSTANSELSMISWAFTAVRIA